MKINIGKLASILAELAVAAPSVIGAIKPVIAATKSKPTVQGSTAIFKSD